MKLDQAIEIFLMIDRAELTNRQYAYVLGAMAEGIGAKRPVRLIRYEDVLAYFSDLRERGVKSSTRDGYINVIKAFFNWCTKNKYIKRNPAADLKRRGRGTPAATEASRAIPPAELKSLVEAAKYNSLRNYAMILFMVDTGCRTQGVISMKLERLNLEDGSALLLEKGSKWHRAFFGQVTADALSAWLEARPNAAHSYLWTHHAAPYEPLQRGSIGYIVRSLSQRAGLSTIWTPHAIRHAVAHAWADHQAGVTATQHKLGHSNPSITTTYYYPHHESMVRELSQKFSLVALETPDEPPQQPALRLVKRGQ